MPSKNLLLLVLAFIVPLLFSFGCEEESVTEEIEIEEEKPIEELEGDLLIYDFEQHEKVVFEYEEKVTAERVYEDMEGNFPKSREIIVKTEDGDFYKTEAPLASWIPDGELNELYQAGEYIPEGVYQYQTIFHGDYALYIPQDVIDERINVIEVEVRYKNS